MWHLGGKVERLDLPGTTVFYHFESSLRKTAVWLGAAKAKNPKVTSPVFQWQMT